MSLFGVSFSPYKDFKSLYILFSRPRHTLHIETYKFSSLVHHLEKLS